MQTQTSNIKMEEPEFIQVEQVNPHELAVEPDVYQRFYEAERDERIERALSKLKPKDREVIEYRFGFDDDPKTQGEIGRIFGVTNPAIQFREKRALRNLRHPENALRELIAGDSATYYYSCTPERERKMKTFRQVYSAIQKRVWANPNQDFRKIADRLYGLLNNLFFVGDLETITISPKKPGRKLIPNFFIPKLKLDRHYFVKLDGKVYDPLLPSPVHMGDYLAKGFKGLNADSLTYAAYK
jgi:hypothetical protein